jgi:hypothetical protein
MKAEDGSFFRVLGRGAPFLRRTPRSGKSVEPSRTTHVHSNRGEMERNLDFSGHVNLSGLNLTN